MFLGNLLPVCHVAADYICAKKDKMSWSALIPSCPLYHPGEKWELCFFTRTPLKITFETKYLEPFFVESPWSLWIWTSDIKNAGTDATIFFQIYGDKGKSDEMKLDNNSDNFEAGQTDKFMVWILCKW